jgi:hypothetical protein
MQNSFSKWLEQGIYLASAFFTVIASLKGEAIPLI